VGLGEKRVRTGGVSGELDELGELGKIGKTPYEMLLVYHNFPAWARGNIIHLCLIKFLSMRDTHPLVAGSRAAEGGGAPFS